MVKAWDLRCSLILDLLSCPLIWLFKTIELTFSLLAYITLFLEISLRRSFLLKDLLEYLLHVVKLFAILVSHSLGAFKHSRSNGMLALADDVEQLY